MPSTIATWNVQRGARYGHIALALRKHQVDVALLQECDVGMARSGNVHVPREIAYAMHADYRMAIEFEERGLGNDEERAALGEARNDIGLHCNAIIGERLPRVTHLVELSLGREWLESDQPRNGGRIALAAKMRGFWAVSVHLESRTTPDKRAAQLRRLMRAIEKLGARSVIIGGDMNNKEGAEPLFDVADQFGYGWRTANCDSGRFAGRRLDWFFVRNLRVENARTIDAAGISDHDLMLVDIVT